MKDERKKSVKEFVQRWTGKGYEKGESQRFWIDLLQNVLGVPNATEYIIFEEQVKLDHTSFIDGYVNTTHVMIEQKSLGKDLRKGIKQSDGSILSPFQQAKRYASELPYSQRPRWIVTCNFSEFLVYNMEKPNGEPEQIFLKDLQKDFYRLQFLVDTDNDSIKREMEISLKTGELVGKLYDLILKQYKNPNSSDSLKSLNMLCVRLVFCLYAEDAGIFGSHKMFGNYLEKFDINEVRGKLIELFRVLDTKPSDRDPYMNDDLSAFPYVNGGLFADENIEIPRFTEEIVNLLLNGASKTFNWAEISPTIFGAVFESTLNPETRRSGGMHYLFFVPILNVKGSLCFFNFLVLLKCTHMPLTPVMKGENMNKERPKQMTFKVSAEEYEIIMKKIADSGLNNQKYILRAVIQAPIVKTDDLKELVIELKKQGMELNRQGNNINQITTQLNARKFVDYKNELSQTLSTLRTAQEELKSLWQSLRQYLQNHQ